VTATPPGPTGNVYDKYTTANPIERRLVASFLQRLDGCLPRDPPARVLEVGIGEGEIAARVAARYPAARVTGLDLPDSDVARGWATRGLRGVFGDLRALPFAARAFDLVLAIEVLEHVPYPAGALRELARVAAGDVVLSVPREPLWRVANLARGRYWSAWGNTPGHVQHWSKAGFVRVVARYLDVLAIHSPAPWTMVLARVPHAPRDAQEPFGST
jgi:SAM-dependent methyltransferase